MKNTSRESKREGRIVNLSSEAHRFSYPEGVRFDKINDVSRYFFDIMFFILEKNVTLFVAFVSTAVTVAFQLMVSLNSATYYTPTSLQGN